MAFTLKNLVTGNESFMPVLEEDGSSVSIEQTIEVETAAAEEAGEVEEVAEEIETSDEEGDTAEEAAELYAKLDYLMDVNATYGLSQPVMAALDFNGELSALVPNLPALESLSMAASPNDSASVIAQEGFKEAMKSFWEWVKKIARKVRDTIVNLASRVAGLFTRLDSTTKRLAKAIADANINDKKLGDRKVKVMSFSDWRDIVGVMKSVESFGNDVISQADKVASNPGAYQSAATFAANDALQRLGISISSDGSIDTSGMKDKLKGSEDTVSGHGWNKVNTSNNSAAVGIFALGKVLPNLAAKLKGIASKLESTAARMENKTVGDDNATGEAKKVREGARAAVKMITAAQKFINMGAKVGFQLVREFIKAQRAVYACRGNYDSPGDDKK